MKWLITGLNGTLAPRLAQAARAVGTDILAWDRTKVSVENTAAIQAFLESERPDAIAHLAMGSPAWAAQMAHYAAVHQLPFVFTSTAMVFDHQPNGPHLTTAPRNAQDDYGRYKIECEDAILAANSKASIVRIGWQIDPTQAGNNMLMALDQWQTRDGCVAASNLWKPACSFMEDTAAAIIPMLQQIQAGVVHLDSNADEGYTFNQIVAALKQKFSRQMWVLRVHSNYQHDQRLVGNEALMPPLSARLPL